MGNVGNKPLPLVEQVLLKSGVDAKSGPDAATLQGVKEFVRSDTQHGYGSDTSIVGRYQAYSSLMKDIGMSPERRRELLSPLYETMNRGGQLEDAGVVSPRVQETQPETSAARGSSLDPKILAELKPMLSEEQSIFRMKGVTLEQCEKMPEGDLKNAMQAQVDFRDASQNYWPKPNGAPTPRPSSDVLDRLKDQIAHLDDEKIINMGLAHTTNKAPMEAVRRSSDLVVAAAAQGYKYTDGEGMKTLLQAGQRFNMAIEPVNTLASRGVDTQMAISHGFDGQAEVAATRPKQM